MANEDCPLCGGDGRYEVPGYCLHIEFRAGGVTRTVPKERASEQAELAAIDARLQAAYAAGFQSAAPAEGSECEGATEQPQPASGAIAPNAPARKRKPKRKPTKRTSAQVTRGAAQAQRDQRAAAFWAELGTAVEGNDAELDAFVASLKQD